MQKSSFLLVSFLLFVGGILFSACKFNPNYQGRGIDFIQGAWEEVPVPYKDSLLQYTLHKFRFTCDSVYVTLETHAKANYYPDSCFNDGVWKEYAKGNYIVRNDTLYIISTFTKSNYKQKLSGCYRIGQYLPTFLIKKRAVDRLELQGLQQHIPLTMKLIEKVECNPKPL
ncbi:fumarate hydratase [Pedobacter sp. P351]|uniref:fumarate hydratase n=1 Tax=Pedobacter superstes TaxID=3133441 RepID=UPI00309EE221